MTRTDARESALRARETFDLPYGGENFTVQEVHLIARKMGISARNISEWSKRRIIFELVNEYIRGRDGYSWADAKEAERDYSYLQAGELDALADRYEHGDASKK